MRHCVPCSVYIYTEQHKIQRSGWYSSQDKTMRLYPKFVFTNYEPKYLILRGYPTCLLEKASSWLKQRRRAWEFRPLPCSGTTETHIILHCTSFFSNVTSRCYLFRYRDFVKLNSLWWAKHYLSLLEHGYWDSVIWQQSAEIHCYFVGLLTKKLICLNHSIFHIAVFVTDKLIWRKQKYCNCFDPKSSSELRCPGINSWHSARLMSKSHCLCR